MKLAYFVHDLTDPAVARRVRMLKAGGAEPVVLGFRREATAPKTVEGVPAIDLGRTYDARMLQRAAMTGLNAVTALRLRRHIDGATVIMARTLEMLAVASSARMMTGSTARLVYECLDIHRLMLGQGRKSQVMRAIERSLMRRADLLMVSSPAFLDAYFGPTQGVGRDLPIPTLLVENKVLELEPQPEIRLAPIPAGPPWRVSWMGAIRCRKSLAILTDLAARRPDLIEVRIHGRPAYTEFDDFDGQVAALPNVSFGGAYTAADLPRLYSEAHFAWAIDFMEEGLNSSWLLPNRLYEASLHGAVPIALSGVETGRYLARHGFGLRIERPEDLESRLESMSAQRYAALREDLSRMPRKAFVAGPEDCRMLVRSVAGEAVSGGAQSTSRKLVGEGLYRSEHIQGEAV